VQRGDAAAAVTASGAEAGHASALAIMTTPEKVGAKGSVSASTG
jgi:hypothetical protein